MIVRKHLIVLLTLAISGCGQFSSDAKQQTSNQAEDCIVSPYLDSNYTNFCQKNVLAARLYRIGGYKSHLYEAYFEDGSSQLVFMSHVMEPKSQLNFIITASHTPLSLVVDKDSWKPVDGTPFYRDKSNVYCLRQRHTGDGNLWVLEEIDGDKLVSVANYKSSDSSFDRELQERKTEFPDLVATDGAYLIDMFCNVLTFEDFLTRTEKYRLRWTLKSKNKGLLYTIWFTFIII